MSKVEEGPRSALHFLAELGGGDAVREMSEELHELAKRLLHETTTRDAKADPSRSTTPGVAWLTAGGNFANENPRQAELPGLREVPGGRANSPPKDLSVGRDIDSRGNAAPKEA